MEWKNNHEWKKKGQTRERGKGKKSEKREIQPVLSFINCFYTPHSFPRPPPPASISPYILVKSREKSEGARNKDERRWWRRRRGFSQAEFIPSFSKA